MAISIQGDYVTW